MNPIKLSQAIRLGIGMVEHGVYCHNCTLGTALLAVGESEPEFRWNERLRELWPWIFTMRVPSSDKKEGGAMTKVYFEIQNRNGWADLAKPLQSREQIAAWIETIEPKDVPETVPDKVHLPEPESVEIV